MLLSDEVYTLCYFNDHITICSFQIKCGICYIDSTKKSKRRFKVLYVIYKG